MKKHNKLLFCLLVVSFLISLFPSISYAGVLKIKTINNLNSTVYINTKYSLPKMVNATMSNNATQKVVVAWSPKIAATSTVGTFVYKGTVNGFAKKVILTLKVVALPIKANTNTQATGIKDTTKPTDIFETKPIDTSSSTSETKDSATPGGISEPKTDDTNLPNTQNNRISTNDAEILRAISYGFVPENIKGDWDEAITFSQYCTMVKNMLSVYDSSLVPEWGKTASKTLASNDTMHRDHGMLATYYAACLMGIGQTTNSNWHLYIV